ncbi:ABC transporter permease subunit [Paenibacillus sp. WQ 127069]|uniref:ABC transporter permease subunit n=1 Tax=Paenibacillus baimaensis TaxID=2982185 RepID=A0ABT2UKA7_9BACL|nr:ABC transporter permease subunit [Paenibacillus sp. WQ 127069]MCU6794471.1 ABC transporter permease subunit [Paenibacillus sp. WQ 127069]
MRETRKLKQNGLLTYYNRYKILYLLSLPGIIYFVVFKYIPLAGSMMAFQNYSIFEGIWKSEWVGMANFQRMFEFADFWRILKNTLAIGFYTLVFGFPIPIILALMMNELRNQLYKRFVQTAVYLPHFLSWVVVGGIVIEILSPTSGVVNHVLTWFGQEPIYFMGEDSHIRTIIVSSGIWRDAGWSTIIYLAAMSGINPDLYEAAQMDGATRWRQTISITIPSIMTTITILFLLQIGNFLDLGFERVFVFLNPLTNSNGDILDTYIYRVGLIQREYSYTTAIGLFKSVIGFVLIVTANTFSKRATGEGLY